MLIDFLKEELVYIFVSLFIFGIAAFVVTRPFVQLNAKKVLLGLGGFLIVALVAHYTWRLHHIENVKKAFAAGKNILCLDKTNKIGYVLINKGEWKIVNEEFVHPEFPRGYNIRQCVVE
ncbi:MULTISPECIES: hypothetical protein [unclassified Nitratiruptor]|uniref:hypothetical protein n=1 Tax=unclassified Nitratiruptor TaxID=2624044 RepID=UPI0019164211|nr:MULTISPECIES: hypothetical protein [unclassified Nitratiruptor]BCD61053.1 hypothetical protein NitYY0810_C1834 [Nitratiruptor sp. YY08-10]BCD64985.1 hypothetical protein NitYY0814_C1842 [Nitratiruptor sp. YY08-14]